MDIRCKKWELIKRDPLCKEFDKFLYESLNNWKDKNLQKTRKKLERQINNKWHVNVYVPEVNVKLGQMFEKNPRNPILNTSVSQITYAIIKY